MKQTIKYFISIVWLLLITNGFALSQNTPPSVTITDPLNGSTVDGGQVTLSYHVSASAPKSVKISVNGKTVQLLTDAKLGANTATVDIPDKNCAITIVAQNEFGASAPATVNLVRSENIFKPTLYVLAIGVSAYNSADLRLQFPAKDASDFTQAMLRQAGLLYERVELKVLTDRSATEVNIRDGLNWLQTQTTNRDVAMLFIAGHGINSPTDEFYFMPVNADIERINATCVSYKEIKNTISNVPGKLLVFLDACHSGNVLGDLTKRSVSINEAVNEIASAGNSPVVYTSSTGAQYSLESPDWNNGVFTKALVEGLNGAADLSDTKTITIKSLDYYIANRVKELTKGRQAPTTIIPGSVSDFPVAVVTETTVTIKVETKTHYVPSAELEKKPKTSEMVLGITTGISAFGDVSFADIKGGGYASIIGADAIWFLNRYVGAGLKMNMQMGKLEFGEATCDDRVTFLGPALYLRLTNKKRLAFTAGAGAGALNWNWRLSTWNSDTADHSAVIVGGFFTAGVNFMATQHIGFGFNVQTMTGKISVDEYTRNPAGIGGTVGVNFRF